MDKKLDEKFTIAEDKDDPFDIYNRQHVSLIQPLEIAGLLLYNDFNQEHLRESMKGIIKKDVVRNSSINYFRYQKVNYIWDPSEKRFFKLRALDGNTPCAEFYTKHHEGLTDEQAAHRQAVFGFNQIIIRVKPILLLLVQEVLNPFYIFQLFSVSVWFADEYYYYAVCIILMSGISIGVSLYTTRTQSVTLRDMVYSDTTVQVLRNGEKIELGEDLVVPGDVIIIPPRGCSMTCDAVLLSGNCIVNESMLTGESVPVTKIPLPKNSSDKATPGIYVPDDHKRNTLFCGTRIIQTRGTGMVKAVVVRTGFSTTKGSLVRSILYPRPTEIKLHRDAIRFVIMLSIMAGIGFLYTIIIMVKAGSPIDVIIIRALDIITIAVPPALPASLTIGMVYAQLRLKRQGVFCISPTRINLCGMMDVVCFDKTGTLTEDGLDLMGVQEVLHKRFSPLQNRINSIQISRLISGMASCHSLTMIEEELAGDPIDLKMFQATGWIFEEPRKLDSSDESSSRPVLTIVKTPHSYMNDDSTYYEIGIIRQFPFSSNLQRMSVVTRTNQNEDKDHEPIEVFVKGAPEMVASLSKPETVPDDFADVLDYYTQEGFRVLALAYKTLDNAIDLPKVFDISRDEVESDLEFLGILILQNKLKVETKPVILQLRDAQISTKMVTGDNILTAINVAHKCEMISPIDDVYRVTYDAGNVLYTLLPPIHEDVNEEKIQNGKKHDNVSVSMTKRHHLAIDGKTFEQIRAEFPEELEKIAVKGTVFGRMSPDQKTQLVDVLQHLDYSVGMCGDGANDCGALKTAHAGIALCEAEASVAAPFTSKTPNITCVPIAIREGRAALTTSFGMFKFMALYSMIQFVSVMILYSVQSNLSDLMFLYIDIVVCTTVVLLMGRTEAYDQISPNKPAKKLMNPTVIFSILAQVSLQTLFQLGAFLAVKQQSWYDPNPVEDPDEKNLVLYESTSVFLLSTFQYIIVALIYTPGPPYRKPIYTNILYVVAMLIITVYTLFMLFFIPDQLLGPMDMILLPDNRFKFVLFGLVLLNTGLALLIEYVFVRNKRFIDLITCRPCRKANVTRFRQIEMQPIRSESSAVNEGNGVSITTTDMAAELIQE
ncbi:polyamine-transporting ATPase 13A3-like [Amphiura filiformis]|uniref:polyamine-transporting ATPase 13A3-like n=1 Tax=Amphiura filiformis TaxID=82378 RepID=UPI003B21B5C8